MTRKFLRKFTKNSSFESQPIPVLMEKEGYLYATNTEICIRTSAYKKLKKPRECFSKIADSHLWDQPKETDWIKPILIKSTKDFPHVQEVMPKVFISQPYVNLISEIDEVEVQYNNFVLYFRSKKLCCEGFVSTCSV